MLRNGTVKEREARMSGQTLAFVRKQLTTLKNVGFPSIRTTRRRLNLDWSCSFKRRVACLHLPVVFATLEPETVELWEGGSASIVTWPGILKRLGCRKRKNSPKSHPKATRKRKKVA
jgi:hypothetical protein